MRDFRKSKAELIAELGTARRKAEEVVTKSEASLNEAQRSAHVGSFDWDIEKDEITVSDELRRIFGVTEKIQPTYQAFLDSIHPDDVDRVRKEVNRALKRKRKYDTEFRIITPKGKVLDIHARGTVKIDTNGIAKSLSGTNQDITERKVLEEQLRQSQKMEALGTLAGGIAHDFNNILMPIIGFSDLLLENFKGGSEEYLYLTTIAESAKRAADLVSQILLFSRRSQAAKSVFDLLPVTKEVIKLVRSTLPITIAIETRISKDLGPVYCDSSQIHQVLVNLCVNAGQAISGIGKIRIALENKDLERFECFDGKKLSGKYVRIAVADSGIGMDKETLRKIFDPFFTTKAVGEGTGLGLSTVFGIVRDHGGGIALSSELGKGTTFEVFLPFAEGIIEKVPNTRDPARDIGTENILYIDDEETITNLGRISLERLGYHVRGVSDGQTALEIFASNPERFNLVVTDQTMPNMTGETLAHELLKLRPDIPIILCTGHSEAISPERSKAIGISRFLYKPFAPEELERVVREVLDQAKEVSPRT